jgi:hypothetical protein
MSSPPNSWLIKQLESTPYASELGLHPSRKM